MLNICFFSKGAPFLFSMTQVFQRVYFNLHSTRTLSLCKYLNKPLKNIVTNFGAYFCDEQSKRFQTYNSMLSQL